uniref:Uncharacterized protein n=1 Tax=Anguilla anguilla TaxID=7936 RepID=A0A0E9QXR5_ANGAN
MLLQCSAQCHNTDKTVTMRGKFCVS